MEKKFDINKLVRANVAKMKAYSSARDEFTDFDKDMVFLDANENPFDNGVNRYPDPQQGTLRSIVASQKGIAEDTILFGNGSDEVLDLIFRAFCVPGKDNVISLPPTYGMYNVLANTNDIENREVLLTQDFQPDIEAIFKQVDAYTKLLFLCSPNNPTGNLIEQDRIETILNRFDGVVVIDEAYIDFASSPSWITKLEKYPNLIITQTLSKAYGMAGIRLGMTFASAEIIQILKKIKPPYNVNGLTQEKAIKHITKIDNFNNEISSILDNKGYLYKALIDVNFVNKIFPSEANFLLVQVDDAGKRYQQLVEKGIVVRNRSTQPLCKNTLRFTIGTTQENEQLIAALKAISN
ncbi:histidinol-phosphate aminotransferase [Dokdonia pacifica]|uniref:Histidinol-phosphate aminotransferase n=1 Tax=Dokdonia pacifica TaxID=1627892 RepID=A0A239D7V9_9FLAO|nr:histidinol-phosphate transaminase [Dokdonia pacifica]GGG40509.1 histidinol-phosphate aminotransferase [Dokdonia pacifica]SNS28262.1 histidinol-phosphate aminotransferase [Dokdonia pacifica]